MSLRTRLIVVFLLLGVIPLGLVVLLSYRSSLQVFRNLVAAEAAEVTAGMEQRMASIAGDLDRQMAVLSSLPMDTLMGQGDEAMSRLEEELTRVLGDQLTYLETVEFVPEDIDLETMVSSSPGASRVPHRVVYRVERQVAAPEDGEAGRPWVARLHKVMGGRDGGRQVFWDWQTEGEDGEVPAVVNLTDEELILVAAGMEPLSVTRLVQSNSELARLLAGPAPPAPLSPPGPADHRETVIEMERSEFESETAARAESEGKSEVLHHEAVAGHLRAQLRVRELLERVLEESNREQGELPFAVDDEGRLHVVDEEHRKTLEELLAAERDGSIIEDEWLLVTREDPETGIRFGLAHPVGQGLEELRATAARNFGWGLAVIGLCFVGMLPLSGRMTRRLEAVTEGTERLARGDLQVQVPVAGGDEIGRLGLAFNRMAEQLREHRDRLVRQELDRRLLEAENTRRGEELEDARRFQLSLLPRRLPDLPGLRLAVSMTTATEVGGDYYDVCWPDGADPILAVGDATGHGTVAGTMVTVVKSLFTARAGASPPAGFLAEASRLVRSMELGRRAMALTLLRFEGQPDRDHRLTVAAAGMPPVLHWRAADQRVSELAFEATPLGARLDSDYQQRTVDLAPGDTLLVTTDGFPELLSEDGEPLGYERARAWFAEAVAEDPRAVLTHLHDACRRWRGERAITDDVTFLAIRVTGE